MSELAAPASPHQGLSQDEAERRLRERGPIEKEATSRSYASIAIANTFTVFNRWGNKVFEATPYTNTWDGTSQFGSAFGELLPESTYYYVLDPGTGDEVFNGYIYLRR